MSHIDLIPPENVAKAAALGLRLRQEHHRGGTQIGVARARDLSHRRRLSEDTIRRMASYFARHAVDRSAEGFGDKDAPSAGWIAWLLWGGDEGRAWCERKKAELERAAEGNRKRA
ncbi:hypothetical protein ASE63_11225 [Bosea sp. Root381]|uniref:hypothetical protein n=1 Tax=Bosea sp. Root381 TaxID=1736524 RepID=UPI0006FF6314|nr:hypothetical protein [Bosea sp. Root381]KRD96263.1 hypothetical protein ASE63_11225 [Bosea sp. Root381]